MPTAYFDTSALVKRYVTEVGSVWVRHALARSQRQVISTALLAQPEVLSALQRKVREGTLTATEAQHLARRVQRHFARRYRVVAITPRASRRRVHSCRPIPHGELGIDWSFSSRSI